jgi:hypothetical protein
VTSSLVTLKKLKLFILKAKEMQKEHNGGIYSRSPITMVAFFLFGVVMSVGHHLYNTSLAGQVIGDVNDYQMVIRSVSILSFNQPIFSNHHYTDIAPPSHFLSK